MQSIAIITKSKFLERDYSRYGIAILKKNFSVDVIDLSIIKSRRSYKFYKSLKLKKITQPKNLIDLFKILKKKKYDFIIDYSENSLIEIIIRFYIKISEAKIIKYLGGIKPRIFYDDLEYSKTIVETKRILSWLKYKSLKLLNKYLIDLVIVTGRDYYYQRSLVDSVKNILYSHTYDYNTYNKLKKKTNHPKKYFLYIDQNFINHPDFYIKKRRPFVDQKFYTDLEIFFSKIEKKYKIPVKIAIHPKTTVENNIFTNRKRISKEKTSLLIKNCKHVFAHYSTAISFAVLFKKPMTFLTSNDLKKIRQGYQTKIMSKTLDSQLLNIDEKKKFKLMNSYNQDRYLNYKQNYVIHPKSDKKDTWILLTNYLKKLKYNKDD